MNGLPLLAFVIYFYLPHIIFKTAADLAIDLGRKRDSSQIEEFLFAAIPSSAFNAFSAALVFISGIVPGGAWASPHWKLISSVLFSDAGYSALATYLESFNAVWLLSYILLLTAVSAFSGLVYGRAYLQQITRRADRQIYTWMGPEPRGIWKRIDLTLSALIFTFGHLFYNAYQVSIFPWSHLRPFVFVKAKDDQMLHGRFKGYTKTGGGEIEMIILTQVMRYSRRKINDVLKEGKNPLTRLEGELRIKWSEVIDVNEVPPSKIRELWKGYEVERMKRAEPENEE